MAKDLAIDRLVAWSELMEAAVPPDRVLNRNAELAREALEAEIRRNIVTTFSEDRAHRATRINHRIFVVNADEWRALQQIASLAKAHADQDTPHLSKVGSMAYDEKTAGRLAEAALELYYAGLADVG